MSASQYSEGRPGRAADAWITDLAHDLRQPLSTMQSAVCYLKLILNGNERALTHLDLIEQELWESEGILTAAVASARGEFAQARPAGEPSFELTNAATADVT